MLFLLLNTGLRQVGWMLLFHAFRVGDDLRSTGGSSVSFSGHSADPVHRLLLMRGLVKRVSKVVLGNWVW